MMRYSYFYHTGAIPNYIKSEMVQIPGRKNHAAVSGLTISQKQVQINYDYLDGLGRLIQRVNEEFSPGA